MSTSAATPVPPPVHFVESSSPAGPHKVAYRVWGADKETPAACVVCVHALTGNSTNFTFFAEHLANTRGFRVVALDVIGRGDSAHLADKSLYNYSQYCDDVIAVIVAARASVPESTPFFYIGNSMGGLIAMHLFSQSPVPPCLSSPAPFAGVIFNDIGPEIPAPTITGILKYAAKHELFPSREAAAARVKANYAAAFGPTADDRLFDFMTSQALRPDPSGSGFRFSYDVEGMVAGLGASEDGTVRDFWPQWRQIDLPVLVLWGEDSVVLTEGVVDAVKSDAEQRGRAEKTEVVRIAKTGHLPPLYAPSEIEIVGEWIDKLIPARADAKN